MRMWMVPVQYMCRKHLLGEHVEHHMLVGSIHKGLSMRGLAPVSTQGNTIYVQSKKINHVD